MKRWLAVVGLVVAAGCGGAPSTPPQEAVTASWTSGDDGPLEGPSEGAAEDAE